VSEPSDFNKGVLWAAARIVEMFDEPTIAATVLRESQIPLELRLVDEADRPYLKDIFERPYFYNHKRKTKE